MQQDLSINQIREPITQLRPPSKLDDTAFLELTNSIREHGILNPLVVREAQDAETGEMYYEIVDGLQRFTAAKHVGLTSVPCHIVEATSTDDMIIFQLTTNANFIQTKPVQFAKHLQRYLENNPTTTLEELAGKVGKSPQWIRQRLTLQKLNEEIQPLVDEGKVTLTNAYALTQLPVEVQAEYIEQATTLPPDEFRALVSERAKEIRKKLRQGQKDTDEFKPASFAQKGAVLKEEMQTLANGQRLINKYNIKDPLEAWAMCMKWVFHLDPDSVEEQRQEWEKRQKEKEEKKKQREAEKAARRAAELEAKAKEAKEAAEALGIK